MKVLVIFILVTFSASYSFAKKGYQVELDSTNQSKERVSESQIDKQFEANLSNGNWIIISGFLGILGSSFVWLFNEKKKRIQKLVTEKELRYQKLISSIRSFGHGSSNEENANSFILELQLCWMYCPDSVIRKGNNFLESMKNGNDRTQDEKDKLKGEFILEMRKDLMLTNRIFKLSSFNKNPTKLKSTDFLDVYYQIQNP